VLAGSEEKVATMRLKTMTKERRLLVDRISAKSLSKERHEVYFSREALS
jgi:hypothetical protein